jgi:hypothetical protein
MTNNLWNILFFCPFSDTAPKGPISGAQKTGDAEWLKLAKSK